MKTLAVGAAAIAAFLALARVNLDAPGLYYDEVHQAPAAFTWMGAPPSQFAQVPIHGVATMTMPYSGAIKSTLYAAYLRVSGADFTVYNWRMFGISIVAAGLAFLLVKMHTHWGAFGTMAFASLMLTDITVLLTSRHDWGPTALALMLRLLFLGIWLRHDPVSARAAFMLGLLSGLGLYEKTSNIVLLPCLAVAVGGRDRKRCACALAGALVGALPLAVVNLVTWRTGAGLISFMIVADQQFHSLPFHLSQFLTLGQGDWVRRWTMDFPVARWPARLELALLLVLLLAVVVSGPARSRRLVLSYALIGLGLWFLPRRTEAHHWIIGTPFHYAAFVLAAVNVVAPWMRRAIVVLIVALAFLRLPVLATTVQAMAAGRTHVRFDPSFTVAAGWAAQQINALVVSATWGTANQVHALAQGRADHLLEPIYRDEYVVSFARRVQGTDKHTIHVLEVPRVAHLFPHRTAAVYAVIEGDDRWREVPADEAVRDLRAVRVRTFVKDGL